jgi:RNA polymerase sigma-70 factor (ECF subfamily)
MDYAKQADADLMDLVRARDEEGFDALRLRYKSLILRHTLSIVHDADIAEDLVQEAFLRVWTRAEQWDGRGAVRAWLYRISTNLALNSLRSVTRRKETPFDRKWLGEDDDCLVPGWMIDSATPGPEAALEAAERTTMLRGLVDGLPEEKRELVRLVYEAEMELKEAAEALGIPEGTAKSRLFYSTQRLAREWRNQNED